MLEKSIIPLEKDPKALIFYNKMRADYYRYMSEYLIERDNASNKLDIV